MTTDWLTGRQARAGLVDPERLGSSVSATSSDRLFLGERARFPRDVMTLVSREERELAVLRREPGGLMVSLVPPVPPWLLPALERSSHVLELPEDWDSYGADTIDLECALTALGLLADLMLPRTPCPAVVPTSAGGIQLEWHQGGVDLEIEIESPSRITADYEIRPEGKEWEGSVGDDLAPLDEAIRRLTPLYW